MNLKNPELFRSWLIRQLEPICKANPEPVSKYVCALLKKEKSDGELRQSLISQLDIFLDSATEDFVTFLIDVLRDETYLTDDVHFRPAELNRFDADDNIELKIESEREPTPEKEKERRSPSPIQAPTPSPPRKTTFQKSFSPRPRRNRFRNERRRIGGPRRSRRDNSSHSDSPPTERRPVARKRSASGSSESSTKSPRRSWIASRTSDAKKYKHRHFVRTTSPGQRSRSASPKLRRRRPANGNFRKRLPPNSRSNSDDDRNHNVVKRVPPYSNDLPIDLPPVKADLPIIEPTSFVQKQRCVDFESKGYCARGDMCPFDHGPSPIVLDNNLLNGIVPMPPPVHSTSFPDPISYTPQFVNTNFPPSKPPFIPDNPPPISNRELISVPTIQLPEKTKHVHSGKPSFGHIFSSLPPGVSQTTIELTNVPSELNNIPDLYDNFVTFGTITLIQAKRNGDANTALLTFSNATEAALAFINIDTAMPKAKVAWYADSCIMAPYPRKPITPGSQPNAKTYVINRKQQPASTVNAAAAAGAVTAATSAESKNNVVVSAVPKSEPKEKAVTVAADEKSKPNEKVRQDTGRFLSDLIKKKRDLLEKQLASRKEILEKMKSLEPGSKDEKTWQDVLRKLNDVIADNENSIKISLQQRKEYLQKMNIVPMDSAALNSLKLERKNQAAAAAAAAATLAAKETQHQAVSSATKSDRVESVELDLSDPLAENMSDNDDFSVLDQELDDDEEEDDDDVVDEAGDGGDEVESTTTTTTKSSHNADTNAGKSPSNAPSQPEYTRVVVSGFENGDEEDLLQHFSRFGNILDKEFDNTIPSATLIYDSRKAAEDAKKEGRNFQDRLLSVTVYSSKKFQPFVRRPTTTVAYKPPDYNPYVPYAISNPYKYKNPQLSVTVGSRTNANRSVYTYRAETRGRLVSARAQAPSFAAKSVDCNSVMKITDDEDDVVASGQRSDDNLIEELD